MSDRDRNVLNIAEEFPPFYTGHGIYLIKLHKYLEKLGYRFTVVTPRQLPGVPSSEVVEGIQVHRLEVYKKQRFLRFYLKTVGYLIRERRSYRIIHINSMHDRFLLMLLVAKLLGKKVVVQMALLGSDDPLTFLRTFKFGALRFFFIRLMTDRFFPISTPIEQSCYDAGVPRAKVRKIFQGVDTSRFTPVASPVEKSALRERLKLPQDAPLAVFVGAIIARKGLQELLESWIGVQRAMPTAELVLVGPYSFGAENDNETSLNAFVNGLRETIARHGLNVRWIGKTDEVESYMRASDVFVFPSRREGFGNVIIEAMACCLPCIVTPMDGVAADTVLEGKTGYVVSGTKALTDRTVQLLGDPATCAAMGVTGRRVALEKFDFTSIAPQYADLYASM